MSFQGSIGRFAASISLEGILLAPMKLTVALTVILMQLYPYAWVAASCGFLGELQIGYYRDFYFVKHAIQQTGCIDSLLDYSRNEDLTLEGFEFEVRTKSGRVVRLSFDGNQNVTRICSAPQGLLVMNPKYSYVRPQVYTIERIVEHLRDKGIETVGLRDLLANIDDLAVLFEPNYNGDTIPRMDWDNYTEYLGYLYLEIADETVPNRWSTTPTQ